MAKNDRADCVKLALELGAVLRAYDVSKVDAMVDVLVAAPKEHRDTVYAMVFAAQEATKRKGGRDHGKG